MTSPPRERMARRALDLPAPVPPVRPSTTRSLSASTTWKPAAFFSRLPMARPNPRLSGHWAKISVTSLVSKVRRASNTRWAWTSLSPTGPRVWTSCSRNRSANSSKQMTPEVGPTRRRISWADFSGAPVMTVTGALGA